MGFAAVLVSVLAMGVTLMGAEHIRVFSLDTLALYDGQDGQPGYVAYEGRVYDVSEAWPTGSHRGGTAGTDITEEMGDAVHGTRVFDDLPHVGYLATNLWTIEELAYYDGQEGRPGYVAVDGIVYDVSEAWPRGTHRGYAAGTDITEAIAGAAHGLDIVDERAVVGAIVSYVLTAVELSAYDGKDDNRGFIAVNGVIYEVTETWTGGTHRGYEAGNDITEAIEDSAHGLSVLAKLPIVGRLD